MKAHTERKWQSRRDGGPSGSRSQDHERLIGTTTGVRGELAEAGFLIEFNSPGYGAIDLASAEQFNLAPLLLNPYVEQNILSWEWATSKPRVGRNADLV